MDISVIVAFDNNEPLMENFVDQFMPFVEGRKDREMVCTADKCRNIETIEFARACAEKWPNFRLIELDEKAGYSKANNIAAAEAEGEYLLFANTDIFPEPGAIEILRNAFMEDAFDEEKDKPLGAVQGRLLYPQNGKVMSTGHCFVEYTNHHLYQGRAGDDPVVMVPGERQALNSAFLMMPAKVYAEMGGMDEFFYNAYDGMDLTLRTGMAGYRLMYLPEALAWHSTGGSRDYIRHNNEYQSKYFYAHTGRDIKTDVPDYLAAQLDQIELSEEYFPIDCTFNMTWRDMIRELGINACPGFAVEERDSSRVDMYRNIPVAIKHEERPLLFIANHFADVTANARWFAERGNPDDLIIDFFGNAFTLGQLGLS